ncbi:MAG: tetratricopeptide repeat protein [Pseudohongiellaceae bacterium]
MVLNVGEEENIEAIKQWWDTNGTSLLVGFAVVAAGYVSWMFWQNSRDAAVQEASDLYEEIMQLAVVDPGVTISDDDSARIGAIADQLQTEYPNLVYALYASLFSAREAVRAGDLEEAEQELQWLLDNGQGGLFSNTDEGLLLTARLRLGRVILARGEAERALELVSSVDPGSFESAFSELRGDIYVALDRPMDARDSYIAAQQAGSGSSMLQAKIDDLPSDAS